VHGHWGPALPVVYRGAYAYGVPGAREDYIPQNAPPEAGATEAEEEAGTGGARGTST
jgi:cytochrome c oxidase subunit 1